MRNICGESARVYRRVVSVSQPSTPAYHSGAGRPRSTSRAPRARSTAIADRFGDPGRSAGTARRHHLLSARRDALPSVHCGSSRRPERSIYYDITVEQRRDRFDTNSFRTSVRTAHPSSRPPVGDGAIYCVAAQRLCPTRLDVRGESTVAAMPGRLQTSRASSGIVARTDDHQSLRSASISARSFGLPAAFLLRR